MIPSDNSSPIFVPETKEIWTPPPSESNTVIRHLNAESNRNSAFMEEEPDSGNAFDVDPSLIPSDFHGIDIETAVRLTPATLAFHVTRGMWQPADHLLYLASEIAKELLEGNAHLIVTMPARHGKSELLSVWTALWWLDLFPEDAILLATYGADLSQSFSRRVRDTLIELGGVDDKLSPDHKLGGRPRLRTHVKSDVMQAGHFQTPQGGGMTAVGIGGSITGRGANVLFIDDYVKNAEDACSPTNQQKNFDWFVSTAYTRLEPGGSVVVLATRWDVNDLIGMLKANQHEFSGTWRVIELPALAYEGEIDPLGRAPGDPLWPARYPLKRLLQIRSMLGPYFWNAMYQQRPIQKTDVKFEDSLLTEVDVLPHHSVLRKIRSWDLAGTQGGGDWTVGSLISQDGPPRKTTTNTFIEDVVRGQWAQSLLEDRIVETAEADGVEVPIIIEQEPGSSGKNYATYLAETVLHGYNVTVKAPTSNKWLKAQPFLAAVARGRAKMLRASWNTPLRTEFKGFPGGPNDDIVDSVSQGYNELYGKKLLSPTWGRNVEEASRRIAAAAGHGGGKVITGAVFGRRR